LFSGRYCRTIGIGSPFSYSRLIEYTFVLFQDLSSFINLSVVYQFISEEKKKSSVEKEDFKNIEKILFLNVNFI